MVTLGIYYSMLNRQSQNLVCEKTTEFPSSFMEKFMEKNMKKAAFSLW